MRTPNVGWGFLGLAVAICVVYLLNRGVYVGSGIRQGPPLPNGQTYFWKICRYLHFTGVSERIAGSDLDWGVAEGMFCPPLKNPK